MIRRSCLALSLVLALPGAALAEPAASPSPKAPAPSKEKQKDKEPIEVRVIGDKADALQKIPGSGHVVTKRDIERAQPADVAEVLRRVPGLWVRQETGAGMRLDIGVRGLDATRGRRVLVLEDGVPIAINPYGEPDLYYSPPVERMRGIEVVKGSGSILFGPQTIGGVIDFLTLLPPEKREAAVEVQGGQRDYLKLLGKYGDTLGDARYIVQGFYKRGDGFRVDPFQAADIFGKIAYPTGPTSEATLKVGVHDERANSSDVGLTTPMFDADARRPMIAPHDRVSVQRYEISLTHDVLLDESTRLRTLAYTYATARAWRRQDYDRAPAQGVFYERIVGATATPGGAIYFRDSNTIRDRAYHVVGIEPRLEKRFATGAIGHTLDAGLRGLVETARRAVYAGEKADSESGELDYDERSSSFAAAAYVQDRIAFRDDLLVTPGLRFELVRSNRQIERMIVEGAPRDVDIKGASTVAQLIPGIGMVVGKPHAHFFGGLHLGFSPPRVVNAIDPSGRDLSLEAERSINYELGARLSLARALRLEGTGFLSNFTNQIVPSSRAGGETTDLVNAGKTRHLGAEAAATLSLAKLFALGVSLDVSARATISRATFAEGPFAGNALPYAPLVTTSANIDFEHRSGVGAQIAYGFVGAQFADEANTVVVDATGRVGELPAYHIVDAAARYRIAPLGLVLGVSVKNALDRIYIVSRRPDGIFAAGFRQINLMIRWEHR